MARKAYAGAASATTLTSPMTSDSMSLAVANAAGYPTGDNPFVIVIGRGTATEEKLLISDLTGTAMTVSSRGYDGTSQQGHLVGDTVEHCIDANTIDEANAHVNDDTRDDHSQYLIASRHTAAHASWVFADPATPSSVTTANAKGSSATPARSDHTHAIGTGAITSAAMFADGVVEIDGALAAPGDPEDVGLAADIDPGTAVEAARADHVHALGAAVAGAGLSNGFGVLAVNVDNSTVEISSDNVRVKDAGIVNAKLATDAVTGVKIQDAAVTPAKLEASLPRGLLVRDTRSGANQASNGTTDTTVTGLQATCTPASSTRYLRIHVFCDALSGGSGAEIAIVKVFRDASKIYQADVVVGNSLNIMACDDDSGSGSRDYTVTFARKSGTGSGNISWSVAASDSFIEVHDVGGH